MQTRAAALVASLILSGCASVEVTPLNPAPGSMQPRPPADVRLFITRSPQQPYEEVFLLRSDAATSGKAIEALRIRAGELGCEAIVITGQSDRIVSTPDVRGTTTISSRQGYVGACIVFE